MRAAKNGDAAAMRVLMAHGADASLKQKNGTTALMLASGVGRGKESSRRITRPRRNCSRP